MNIIPSHLNEKGDASMVDVSQKDVSTRIATAQGTIFMSPEAFQWVQIGYSAKGDILAVARIAAIQGAKQTSQLIPLCHPLMLSHIDIEFEHNAAQNSLRIFATVKTSGKTGVEMEALTAVNIGLLTVYDMLKAVDKQMRISDIFVSEKKGGKSGDWRLDNNCNDSNPS